MSFDLISTICNAASAIIDRFPHDHMASPLIAAVAVTFILMLSSSAFAMAGFSALIGFDEIGKD